MATLIALGVIALLTASACGGSTGDTYFAQWPRGGTSQIPGVTGSIELLLFDSGTGGPMFRAMGKIEGDGLIDNALYSMLLADQGGNLFLIDSGRADEECEVDPDTGEEIDDCEIELRLLGNVQPAPFQITSLVGLTASIREGPGAIGPQALEQAPVVMNFTITDADL